MSCNCGSSCSCGSDCKCGKKYPDLSMYETTTVTPTIVDGVAPVKMYYEGSKGVENDVENGSSGCKCGNGCSCDPCNC